MMTKNTKFYKFGLILSVFLVFLTFVSTIICSILSVNFVRIPAVLECFIIALLLFFFQKYGEQTVSKETDFWIPRKFGLGMSVNPHTKTSKRMTIFLIYFLVFAGLLLIFLYKKPVAQKLLAFIYD
jgi:xanthine/uracil permease